MINSTADNAWELRELAHRYGHIMSALYGKREMRGKIVRYARGARHMTLGVRLANPLQLNEALALAEPLALACRCKAVLAQRNQEDAPGLVSYQFQLADRQWQTVTRSDVNGLAVGLGESLRPVEFGWDAPHAGVFGTTNSGKSVTIRSILVALFASYAPDELRAVIVDPHRDYDDFARCAHLAAPIGPDGLLFAGQELAHRKAENIKEGPRLLVVADEAESVLLSDRRLLEVVRAIAQEGRKFHVNLLIGSQDARETKLPGLISLINNRWVGLVASAQVSAILTGQAGVEAHKLTGRGDFVHVAGATVERLQVALPEPRDMERLPRVEVVESPEIEPEDIPAAVNANSGPGRPAVEIEPRHVAAYLHAGPDKVSIREAKEKLGLNRVTHERHREFALEVKRGLEYLKESEGVKVE